MGCSASTLNTKQNCLDIAQIFEPRGVNKSNSDAISLNQTNCVDSLNSNTTYQQSDVKSDNTASLNIQQASASKENGKKKNFCDEEVQGEADSVLVSTNKVLSTRFLYNKKYMV